MGRHTEVRDVKVLFENSFREFFKSLCFYAMSFVKDEEAAKDIVHDVFLTVRSPVFRFVVHKRRRGGRGATSVRDRLGSCTRSIGVLYAIDWSLVRDLLESCTRLVGVLYAIGWSLVRDRLGSCTRWLGILYAMVWSIVSDSIGVLFVKLPETGLPESRKLSVPLLIYCSGWRQE